MLVCRREVLVIDDNRPLLRWLERNTRHYFVHSASCPEEAWEIVEHHDVHAAIVDVLLARSSGLEIVRPLRLLRPRLRIATASGWPDPTLRERSLDAGADAFVDKPYTVDSVVTELGRTPLRACRDNSSNCFDRSRALADWEYVHGVLDASAEIEARQRGVSA
jgi:two-component system, response regulator RegA